jgi:hypothetical protein
MSEQEASLQPPFVPVESDQIPLWKTAYEKTVWESDTEKLLTEIHVTEEALFHRWQEIDHDVAHAKERTEMEAAAEDLLAIKINRLGWPDPCQ